MSILDTWKKRKAQHDKAKVSKQMPVSGKPVETLLTTEALPVPADKSVTGHAYAVLIRPVLSEKTARQEAEGLYTFAVAKNATKNSIKQAVRQVYGVVPIGVRMINGQGKWVRFGRFTGRRTDCKKALVVLKKGQSIRIHEGV